MEPEKKQEFDEKLNILGPEIGQNPEAFDDDAWMELFEASMLASEQQQESMSEEELEAFTAKNLAGFEKVMERATAMTDAEMDEKPAEAKHMSLEEILEKSSEIEAALSEELGIADITEPEKKQRRPFRLGRSRKVFLLAAAVAVLGLGMTMVTQGNRWYELRQYPLQAERNVLANHNSVAKVDKGGDLNGAYKQIENTLDMTVLVLGDVPFEMKFQKLILDEDFAVLKFELDGKAVYFKQRKVSDKNEMSEIMVSDREVYMSVHNKWLNQEIPIEMNVLKDGLIEYSAGLNENDAFYYLSGIMDEEIFINLVKNIHHKYD